MNIKFDIKLTKSQQQMYDSVHSDDYKYYTFCCSRQSGKSTLMKLICIEWLLKKNVKIAYICKNFLLAKTFYKELVQLIPDQLVKTANASDLIIESMMNSTITFYSAESGASLRGNTFNYLICDEFAFFKFVLPDGQHLWNDILQPTIKVIGRKVIFVSTPLGKNNMFYEMFQRAFNNEFKRYFSIRKTIYDDGLVTKEGIEEIQKSLPELSFRQEYLCEFLDDGISFFQGFNKCFFNYTYDTNLKTYIGIDLSSVGSDATIITKINEDGQTEQIEVVGTLDMKYYQIAKIIDSTPNLQSVYVETNGVGEPMLNEVKKLSYNKNKIKGFTTTNTSKSEQASALALAISKDEIKFDLNNMNLYNQLANFTMSFSKTGKMILKGNGASHDDYVMSMMLALQNKKDNTVNGKYAFTFL